MRGRVAAALTALVLAAAPSHADGLPPHASWGALSWSNGHSAGYYDTLTRRVKGFQAHLYDHGVGDAPTRLLMFDLYFGLRLDGTNAWLTGRPVDDASYDDGSGIARIVQSQGAVVITQYLFAPMTVSAAAQVVVVDIENTGGVALSDAALFSLQNLHVGGGADGTTGEAITWSPDVGGGAYEERGAGGLVLQRAWPAPTAHACSPQNPYATVVGGGHLADVDASGTMDDAVAGFEWDLSGLAPGAHRQFALVLGHRDDGNRAALDAALDDLADAPGLLLSDAQADWAAFFSTTLAPDGMSADEAAVYRQQLAILRMGQVREGTGAGQVVASLPPGMWDIAWVRDQAYAVDGMIAAGMYAEASEALAFWWQRADAGDWVCCDTDGGPWVGTDYALSVVRYTGDGREESDSDGNGPNIEFDGFGLALASLDAYVAATDDDALLTAAAAAIFEGTADVLAGLVEDTGSADGLVRADSSIWETHWYNGGRRHHVYTQATAVRGLRAAARLATRAGRSADSARYASVADGIATAMAQKLVDPGTGVLRSSLEETTDFLDASAVEAWNWGVLAPNTALGATLDAFRVGLWNDEVGHGYHRNDNGGDYDRREWAVIDLRIARAARIDGRAAHADELVAWVTAQARANFDLVPENYDRTTGDYQGEVPMVGFGAGAYVTAMWERGAVAPGTPDAGVGGDGGSNPPPAGDGCCQTARPGRPQPGTLLLVAVVGLFIVRRRRR